LKPNACEQCGKFALNHEFTHCTTPIGSQMLCIQCFNAHMAERVGIKNFENHPLEPISIVDDGATHQFHFQARLLGDLVTLDASELKEEEPAGYQFQLIGTPEEDGFLQLGRLVQRIRETLATKYLEDGKHGLQIKDMEVRGSIEADMAGEESTSLEREPSLVIDGREVTWQEFGRMLTTFEGFQFKLQIVDKSEDLKH
jgi:hypothetical protein